jgi:hypothetical protein
MLRALRRELTPRRPLWIMRQAGRYLPEYRAFREKHSFKALAGSPDLAADRAQQQLVCVGSGGGGALGLRGRLVHGHRLPHSVTDGCGSAVKR